MFLSLRTISTAFTGMTHWFLTKLATHQQAVISGKKMEPK